jgi:hypothetical protein
VLKLPDRGVGTADAEAADLGLCQILAMFPRTPHLPFSLTGIQHNHVCLPPPSLLLSSVGQLTPNPCPNYGPHLSSGNNLLRHTICFKVSLLPCKLSRGEDALSRKCGDVSRGSENLISSTVSFLFLFRFLCFNPYSNSPHFDVDISPVTININHHHV